MNIDRITLRLVTAELTQPFENRWQRYHTWTKLIVETEGEGATGRAECTAMETPFYNYETIVTAWYVIEEYLGPMLLAAGRSDPHHCMELWREVNGHEEAKGAVEAALWDLQARLHGRPLCEELGGSVRPVPVGATIGIEPTVDRLVESAADVVRTGYQRLRLKIRPGWDLDPVREVRAAFPQLPLIADANAAYDESHLEHLAAMDELGLLALEQPFPRHSLPATTRLQHRLDTPICLDEQIHSVREAQEAVRLGACRMINIKTGRVGGLGESVRIHDFCAAEEIPTFMGGKWDQGIGRWTNLALATLPNMTLPSDVGPSDGYYRDDGALPRLVFHEPGWVRPLARPGTGVEPTGTLKVEKEKELRGGGIR
ncbi:o-succinylbenzoate synthase [Streptomyces somaliensis]|uniref:o-succinylbenzoate synthase n=1 Tax=Streptomyces somaliensis TaxID=78355 RepID=UPI0020CBDDB3|nr:o-succinylbenzoate synthase [Streptomyces somaliensis]MCP9943855.1 o-succinylbenzoate synthase [Streptomyces somaliensis]MCP9962899.1 o-succinylbenzoate synthase [Streptomyces somaliensis]MCP9975746.1 o-succinylbenzoate synthase [Streptomyces somaliensis]